MAVAFTSLASWEHAQDTYAAQEIILAYSERRQCVGDAAIDALAAGDVKQDTTFWRGVQDWIETNCVKWVDDAVAIAGESSITMYTLATFRTEAGFETDGFRRATEWPTDWTNAADAAYSFGKITAGDIVGPWIFEDLQKAFDAMRWTLATRPSPINAQQKEVDTGTISELETKWASATWEAISTTDTTYAALISDSGVGEARRRRAELEYTTPNHIAHSAVHYWLLTKYGTVGVTFNTVDYPNDGILIERESFASLLTDTREIPYHSFDSFPKPSGYTSGAYQAINRTMVLEGGDPAYYLILKWEFTNTL